MNTVVVCGISHKTSPIEEREKLSFGKGAATRALRALISKETISECVIVSTCNRVEIYTACENSSEGFNKISEFLCELNGRVQSGFIEENFYFFEGTHAALHLHRVAAGMDSMVVGEQQILGQLKRAYQTALENGTAGPVLNKLFQSAFFSAKKIKNKMGFSRRPDSVASVAADAAKKVFGDISKRSVMVAGTGKAAAEAAVQIKKAGALKLVIAGRNGAEAARLASSVGAQALSFANIETQMAETDILISATGSSNYILSPEQIKNAVKSRKNRPVCLIDIAFPRDIHPEAGNIKGVLLYDMDDLKNIPAGNQYGGDKSPQDEAEEMIRAAGEKFSTWRGGVKAFPLIVELRQKTEKIVNEETVKAISKLDSIERTDGYTKEKIDKVVWALSQALMGKFLHNPVTKLKREAANSPEQNVYADTARKLFNLSGETSAWPSRDENKNRKQG